MRLMVGLTRILPLCAVLLVLFSPILAENALAALITAEPTQGPAGTRVTIHGSAWPPGDLIKLSWNFPPFVTVATARTDGNGAFTATITVPQDAPIRPTEVNAINEAGNRTWQAPFTVVAPQGGCADAYFVGMHGMGEDRNSRVIVETAFYFLRAKPVNAVVKVLKLTDFSSIQATRSRSSSVRTDAPWFFSLR
jgi:hypothetical protein